MEVLIVFFGVFAGSLLLMGLIQLIRKLIAWFQPPVRSKPVALSADDIYKREIADSILDAILFNNLKTERKSEYYKATCADYLIMLYDVGRLEIYRPGTQWQTIEQSQRFKDLYQQLERESRLEQAAKTTQELGDAARALRQ